ncbi:MAG: hypothetical protein Q9213_002476 [Squamulea squamosa]
MALNHKACFRISVEAEHKYSVTLGEDALSNFEEITLFLLGFLPFFDSCSAILPPQANCSTCLSNPIVTTYPHNVTGTINGTTSVVLVPISYARSLLPTRFANSILISAYTSFNIPPTAYPLVVESVIDHDLRFNNSPAIADFSSFRTTFPFIDLLGDGYSSFRYIGHIYLPPTNFPAITGSQKYGYSVLSGYFDPPDAPYKYTSRNERDIASNVYVPVSIFPNYRRRGSELVASTHFRPASSMTIPLSFYKNITNQVQFGNNTEICDNWITFWNTSITTGTYEPRPVVGEVLLSPPFVPTRKVWRNVQGVKADRAFLENNYLSCESLRGWMGTGDGDSG